MRRCSNATCHIACKWSPQKRLANRRPPGRAGCSSKKTHAIAHTLYWRWIEFGLLLYSAFILVPILHGHPSRNEKFNLRCVCRIQEHVHGTGSKAPVDFKAYLNKQLIGFCLCGICSIGSIEEFLYSHQNLLHRDSWSPTLQQPQLSMIKKNTHSLALWEANTIQNTHRILVEYGQADGPGGINVRVKEAGRKLALGRFAGIILGEKNGKRKISTFPVRLCENKTEKLVKKLHGAQHPDQNPRKQNKKKRLHCIHAYSSFTWQDTLPGHQIH